MLLDPTAGGGMLVDMEDQHEWVGAVMDGGRVIVLVLCKLLT